MPSEFNPLRTLVFAGLVVSPSMMACYGGLRDGPLDSVGADGAGDGADGAGADGAADGGDGADGDGGDDGAAAACEDGRVTASAAPLRRLTKDQYRQTIQDVLDDSPAVLEAMDRLTTFTDGRVGAFAATTANVDQQTSRRYLMMAEDIADAYVAGGLPQDLTCAWESDACMETLLDTVGRRIFRRPLNGAERASYLGLYAQVRDEVDAQTGVAALVTALLSSPNFLYLEEPVAAGEGDADLVPLDGFAFASRLSYFLWASGPDDELLDLAEEGALLQADVRAAQIDRMMADARFERTLDSFHVQLMNLGTIEEYDAGASMRHEVELFARHVFNEGSGTLGELLTANYTFVDADLATRYGIAEPAGTFERAEFDPGEGRAGLLTQAGFLTHKAEVYPVVHRGLTVRRNLLCDTIAEPPNMELDGSVNRLETNPCQACHTYIDRIGFAFGQFDPQGRFAPEGSEGPINIEGEIIPISEGTPGDRFEGVAELGALLADSPRVHQCVATQWSRYATGRLGNASDACTMESLAGLVEESGGDLRVLVTSIAKSQWFSSRAADDFAEQ